MVKGESMEIRGITLRTPLSENEIIGLRAGDIIYLTGTVVTARDAAHKRIHEYLAEGRKIPFNLNGLALFHSGPLAKKANGEWIILAAGPTTSMRMEEYEREVIERLGPKLIIGKGGMGENTQRALMEHNAAYAMFTGGAAVLAAKYIKKVVSVEWMDLGMPEAVWTLEVEGFGPLIITMDAHGNNLVEKIIREAEERKRNLVLGRRD
ncbi:MAG: FumA C-terminus/TtdB family hydratase beta subunit [Candidatus Bathyarchaeia archaeon]